MNPALLSLAPEAGRVLRSEPFNRTLFGTIVIVAVLAVLATAAPIVLVLASMRSS